MAEPGRADARRNRERLLASAAAAFATADGPVSLEAIARDAGVGIGTLYRHFPSREALVEAVHRAGLEEVSGLADALLQQHPPVVALRQWMNRYADFVATKKGMVDSLRALMAAGAMHPSDTHARIAAAVGSLLRAGADDGGLRSDVAAEDVVSSLLGIFLASTSAAQTQRMLNLLVDGLVTTR